MLRECHLGRVVEAVKRGDLDPSQLITMKALRDAGVVQRQVRDGVKLLVVRAWPTTLPGALCCTARTILAPPCFRLQHGYPLSDLERVPPLHLEVTRVTEEARAAVEAAGGSVKTVYYSRLCLFALLEPERWWRVGKPLPRAARPKPRHAHKWEAVGAIPAPVEIPADRLRPFSRPGLGEVDPRPAGAQAGRGVLA